MTRFWILVSVLVLTMMMLFWGVQTLQLPFFAEDTSFLASQVKWVTGLAGIGLLTVDVVAPIPSSIVMVASGMMSGTVWGRCFLLPEDWARRWWVIGLEHAVNMSANDGSEENL